MIDVLVSARESAGLSKRELSAMLKRPANFVYYVESGERTLSACEFIEYAHAVGADPAKLVARIGDRI
jgi:ribosome-binding protein aMBF1 (putative translation factor)